MSISGVSFSVTSLLWFCAIVSRMMPLTICTGVRLDTVKVGAPSRWNCRLCADSTVAFDLGEYEGMMDVDARLVTDLIAAAQRVLIALQSPD